MCRLHEAMIPENSTPCLAQEFHLSFITVDGMLHSRRRNGVDFSTGMKFIYEYSIDGRAARQMLLLGRIAVGDGSGRIDGYL